jgi:hypothetical protein
MTFFTTSERLEIGGHPLVSATDKPTRKEALDYYRRVAAAEGLDVRTYTRVTRLGLDGDTFAVLAVDEVGEVRTYRARGCMLATGYFDNPNRLTVAGGRAAMLFGGPDLPDVPGCDLPHVELPLRRGAPRLRPRRRRRRRRQRRGRRRARPLPPRRPRDDGAPRRRLQALPQVLDPPEPREPHQGGLDPGRAARPRARDHARARARGTHAARRPRRSGSSCRRAASSCCSATAPTPRCCCPPGPRSTRHRVATVDPVTRETTVPGLYAIGSAGQGAAPATSSSRTACRTRGRRWSTCGAAEGVTGCA